MDSLRQPIILLGVMNRLRQLKIMLSVVNRFRQPIIEAFSMGKNEVVSYG